MLNPTADGLDLKKFVKRKHKRLAAEILYGFVMGLVCRASMNFVMGIPAEHLMEKIAGTASTDPDVLALGANIAIAAGVIIAFIYVEKLGRYFISSYLPASITGSEACEHISDPGFNVKTQIQLDEKQAINFFLSGKSIGLQMHVISMLIQEEAYKEVAGLIFLALVMIRVKILIGKQETEIAKLEVRLKEVTETLCDHKPMILGQSTEASRVIIGDLYVLKDGYKSLKKLKVKLHASIILLTFGVILIEFFQFEIISRNVGLQVALLALCGLFASIGQRLGYSGNSDVNPDLRQNDKPLNSAKINSKLIYAILEHEYLKIPFANKKRIEEQETQSIDPLVLKSYDIFRLNGDSGGGKTSALYQLSGTQGGVTFEDSDGNVIAFDRKQCNIVWIGAQKYRYSSIELIYNFIRGNPKNDADKADFKDEIQSAYNIFASLLSEEERCSLGIIEKGDGFECIQTGKYTKLPQLGNTKTDKDTKPPKLGNTKTDKEIEVVDFAQNSLSEGQKQRLQWAVQLAYIKKCIKDQNKYIVINIDEALTNVDCKNYCLMMLSLALLFKEAKDEEVQIFTLYIEHPNKSDNNQQTNNEQGEKVWAWSKIIEKGSTEIKAIMNDIRVGDKKFNVEDIASQIRESFKVYDISPVTSQSLNK